MEQKTNPARDVIYGNRRKCLSLSCAGPSPCKLSSSNDEIDLIILQQQFNEGGKVYANGAGRDES